MKNIFKLTLIVIAILGISKLSVAQDNTLYSMHNLHQSISNNPAFQTRSKVCIGLPVINNFYMDFTNTGFTYKNLFSEIPNSPDSARYMLDINQFYEELDDINYLNLESNISIFNLGFWVKNLYITTGMNTKFYNRTAYPKSFLDIRNGNYNDAGNPISLSNFGMDLQLYNEVYLGVSRMVTPKLTLGVKAKMLYGLANFSTDKFVVNWTTNAAPDGFFEYTFNTEFDFKTSSPIYWDLTYDDATGLPNGIDIDKSLIDEFTDENFNKEDVTLIKDNFIFPKKNRGLGIDIGADYNLTKKISLSASLIDFGFIKWGLNPKVLTQKAEFSFKGLDPAPYILSFSYLVDSSSAVIDNYSKDFLDTLINLAKPTLKEETFRTSLNTKIFLGANYHVTRWLDLGVLYKGYFWESKLHSAFTISATANFFKGWSFASTYSVYNGLYNNFGLGLSCKFSILQYYFIMDNIAVPFWILNDSKAANKLIKNTKQIPFHFGLNILLGSKQKDDKLDYGILD